MDYTNILEKAISYMEENLARPISLEDIADHVNLSMYHFHRVFTGCTGFGLKTYLRKCRLNRAARELVFNQHTVRDIARKYQFESQEAFIRAFRREFQITPGYMRKKQSVIKLSIPECIEIKMKKIINKGEFTMEPKRVELKEIKVVGLKCQTTQSNNTIPQLWNDFMQVTAQVPNKINEDVCLGVCLSMESELEDFDENTPFEYIAGHIVDSFDNVPDNMVCHTIRESAYMSFTHKGSLDTLDKTYCFIFGDWFKNNNMEPLNKDQVEWYDQRFNYGQPDSEMDILIPVK